jgi:hypothetical protein
MVELVALRKTNEVALLRRRHGVVLVDLDDVPVLGLGQRPDLPQLRIDRR